MDNFNFNKILSEKLEKYKLLCDSYYSLMLLIKPNEKMKKWKVIDPLEDVRLELSENNFNIYTFTFNNGFIVLITINGFLVKLLELKNVKINDPVVKWCMDYNWKLREIYKNKI